ncbi:MAG: EamA family transporter [Gaiellaceae bacterium]
MTAVWLALGASVAWGFADFTAGLKSRTLGVLVVLAVAQVSGLLLVSILVAARGHGPDGQAVLWAAPAAVAGTLGLIAFLRSMAVGTISIVAPIVGVSAAVPVAYGLMRGDRPSWIQGVGVVLALLGVLAASRESPEPGEARSRVAAGVGLALLAALGFGCYFPFMHAAREADVFWTVMLFRCVSSTLVLAAFAVARPRATLTRSDVPLLVLIGAGDVAGNVLFTTAASHGLVSLVSVLSSLYPVVTIALAWVVLRERLAPLQWAGVAVVLAGVAAIAAG